MPTPTTRLKSGPIAPCLPRASKEPPSGPGWVHEIKHDGFRILARRDRTGVRLYTRNGYNFAARFPMIVEAIASLPVRSCFIDGEAIVVDANGLSVFNMIRYRQHDRAAVLCAFDLIELDGEDLRLAPLQDRKRTLADLLGRKYPGIAVNTHYEGDGPIIFKHACALGCEGIVSKRLGSPYRSGRVDHWLKIKNPAAPAVRRERRRIGAASARGEGEHMAVVCPLKTVAEIASAIFGLAAAGFWFYASWIGRGSLTATPIALLDKMFTLQARNNAIAAFCAAVASILLVVIWFMPVCRAFG
jgi:bifunctional non-homologous end joining protein LigD